MSSEIVVPTEQEGTTAIVKTWLKRVGDSVRINDPIVELETDKVAVEIAATSDGVLTEILIEEGAEVAPGTVLGRVAAGESAASGEAAEKPAAPATVVSRAPTPSDDSRVPPGIRKLLEEHRLEAREVPFSGARL